MQASRPRIFFPGTFQANDGSISQSQQSRDVTNTPRPTSKSVSYRPTLFAYVYTAKMAAFNAISVIKVKFSVYKRPAQAV